MKRIFIFILCAAFLAGCQLIGPAATGESPSAEITATADPNATPTVKPTEGPVSAGDIMNIYKKSMADYKIKDYYNFHNKMVCNFTADGTTSPIYRRDLTAQGKNVRTNAHYFSHLYEELYEASGNNEYDWTIWDQSFYADLYYMYMKLNQTWTKYPENNRELNQYCSKPFAKSFADMLASRINFGTYVTINEVTGATISYAGGNTVYTFSLDNDKVKTLVERMLAKKQLSEEFTINSCWVIITVDAQNNVLKDELRANVDVSFNGVPGTLDITDYTEYFSQTQPQINKPAWAEQCIKVDRLTP